MTNKEKDGDRKMREGEGRKDRRKMEIFVQ